MRGSRNKLLKTGAAEFCDVLTQFGNSKIEKIDPKTSLKYKLIEKLFEDFRKIDEGNFKEQDLKEELPLSGNISTAEHSAESTYALSDSDHPEPEDEETAEYDSFEADNNLGKRNFEDWGEMKAKDMNHYGSSFKIDFTDDFLALNDSGDYFDGLSEEELSATQEFDMM